MSPNASRDQNFVTTLMAVSNVDGVTPVTLYADPVTHRLLTSPTGSGSGDVVGPASSTDNAIARFDLTTGKLLQNSNVTISDAGAITVAGAFTLPVVDGTNLQVLTTNGAGVVTWATPATGGTVTSVSVVTANGFAGTVATATTTPAITLTTSVNAPALAGNGTAISAATTTGTGSTVVLNTSPTLVTPALGTPSSGVVTNLTGTASININGTVGATTPTTGAFTTATANSFIPNSATIPSNGMYLPAANTLGWGINSAAEMQLTASALSPIANDGLSLGTTTLGWGDLFGATGFVLNIANSNWVATHTSGILTVGTGDLRVTTAGTNTASVVTVGGGQTLTGKTLTSPVIATIASNTLTLGTGTFTTLTFDAGASDPVITAASGILTVSTGELRVTTVGTNTASVMTNGGTATVTNKRPQPRTASSTTASNLSPDLSTANVYYRTTQTATLTIDAPTGTPVIGETIMIYVDSAGAQTLTINATYIPFGAAFPATTTAGKTFMMSAQYNGTNWKTLWANAV